MNYPIIDGNFRPKTKQFLKRLIFKRKIQNFFQNHFQNFTQTISLYFTIFSLLLLGSSATLLAIILF